jgi:hypothetical protein
VGTRESFARVAADRYAEQLSMHDTSGYTRWAKRHVLPFTARELRAIVRGADFDRGKIGRRRVGLSRPTERLPARVGELGGWYLIHDDQWVTAAACCAASYL